MSIKSGANAAPTEKAKDYSLRDIDEIIALAKRRLARLEAERNRELDRQLRRLLYDRATDSIGNRLVRRLDELIKRAEDQVEQLEARRAETLLDGIDGLLLGGGE